MEEGNEIYVIKNFTGFAIRTYFNLLEGISRFKQNSIVSGMVEVKSVKMYIKALLKIGIEIGRLMDDVIIGYLCINTTLTYPYTKTYR